MKILKLCVALIVPVFLLMGGCVKEEKSKFPKTPPDKVVMRFFELLAQGGKLTTKEALRMVSFKYSALDDNLFRRWTQQFNGDSKIKIVKTTLPKEPNKRGDLIAVVKLEVQTPSSFGGSFSTFSTINLILDDEAHEWKIDFLATTLDEDKFFKAPTDARLEPDKE